MKSHREDRYFRSLADSKNHMGHSYHTVASSADIQHMQVRLFYGEVMTRIKEAIYWPAHHEAFSAQCL